MMTRITITIIVVGIADAAACRAAAADKLSREQERINGELAATCAGPPALRARDRHRGTLLGRAQPVGQ